MHQGIAGSRHFVWAGQWSINRLLRSTIRQRSADIARGYDWPAEFTGRVLRTAFVSRWDGREAEHRAVAEAERPTIWQLWLKDGPRITRHERTWRSQRGCWSSSRVEEPEHEGEAGSH
jgi:hypothetical protein